MREKHSLSSFFCFFLFLTQNTLTRTNFWKNYSILGDSPTLETLSNVLDNCLNISGQNTVEGSMWLFAPLFNETAGTRLNYNTLKEFLWAKDGLARVNMVLMAWLDSRENLEYLENGWVTSTVDSALPGITRIRIGQEAPCDPVVLHETGLGVGCEWSNWL